MTQRKQNEAKVLCRVTNLFIVMTELKKKVENRNVRKANIFIINGEKSIILTKILYKGAVASLVATGVFIMKDGSQKTSAVTTINISC